MKITYQSIEKEIELKATRSSGPGGQHVNKVSTKVVASWNVQQSTQISEEQRTRLLSVLVSKLTIEGVLIVGCQQFKSQNRNKEAVIEKIIKIINNALIVEKPRKATRPTKASKNRRLKAKKFAKEKKQRPTDD